MALLEPLASLSSYAAGLSASSQIQMLGVNILLFCLWWLLRQCRDKVKPALVISEIWVYPVKSCAGVQLHGAALDRGGLQWDRQFAIIKPDGEVSPVPKPKRSRALCSRSVSLDGIHSWIARLALAGALAEAAPQAGEDLPVIRLPQRKLRPTLGGARPRPQGSGRGHLGARPRFPTGR